MNEKYEMNMLQVRSQFRAGLAIWWCLSGVTTFIWLALALVSKRIVRPFPDLFQGLHVGLSWPTRTYSWPLPTFCLGLGLVGIIIAFSNQIFGRNASLRFEFFLLLLRLLDWSFSPCIYPC